MRSQNTANSKKDLDKVENELAEKYSEKMYNIIKHEIAGVDSEDGGFNSGRLWRLKKKLAPTKYEPPTAMKNSEGQLLTSDDDIKKEAVRHYEKVFEDKPMEETIKHMKELR